MRRIKLLPKIVIAKVAAGEVIERPSSVVKELIENALDANPSKIEADLENGGLDLIRVTDDGDGISPEDLEVCFKRYTTSKIFHEEDLAFIRTFGFRGEALFSISSVSHTTIVSRPKGSVGGRGVDVFGEAPRFFETGMSEGTCVTVSSLFFNLPARKKFLKSQKSELKKIIDLVIYYSLAFPGIRFILRNGGLVVVDTLKTQEVGDRIESFFGKRVFDNLIAVSYREDGFSFSGFVSKPQLSLATKAGTFVFVNKRPVFHKTLQTSVRDAYGSLLDPRSFPYAFLFYEISPDLLDVNVHPRKEEIRFFDDSAVSILTRNAIKECLGGTELTFKLSQESSYGLMAETLLEERVFWDPRSSSSDGVLQLANLYLVAKTNKGLLVFDQHACHEKILFNELLLEYKEKTKGSGPLENPLVVEIPANLIPVLEENLEVFSGLGFEVEGFGGASYKISSAPLPLKNEDLKGVFFEILEKASEEEFFGDIDSVSRKLLSYIACRLAIKGGEPLDQNERERLVEKVLSSPDTYTCPHGRPVMIEISLNDLDKLFKRK